MGNSIQVVNQRSTKDFLGSRLTCTFQTGSGDGQYPPARYVQRVVKCSGGQPSYAIVSIPMNTFRDEAGPTCALLLSGPAGQVTLRSRAACSLVTSAGVSTQLLVGSLVTYTHGIGNDSLGAMIIDDRWILSKFTCFGRWTYDPANGNYFLDPVPLVFNAGGWPDCMDTPQGPVFAPAPRYGYKQQYNVEDIGEPAVGQATTRARSWTVMDAITHLRNRHAAEAAGKMPMNANYGSQRLPAAIAWPESMAQVFGANRTLKNFKVENLSLLDALQKICRKAGAYDLYCVPAGGFKSTLKIVNMNPKDHSGGQYYLPSYISNAPDIGMVISDSGMVWGGTLTESIVNYFDDVTIAGDPPAVERFVSIENNSPIDQGLDYAWDRGPNNDGNGGDEQAFKDYMDNNNISETTKQSAARFQIACKLWPDVFCTYRMKKGYDIWTGTKYQGTKNQSAYARIKAYLLSGFNQNATNPGDWDRLPITVEYDPKADNHWQIAQQFNGQEVMSDERTLRFTHLRDNLQQTWYNTNSSKLYQGSTMKPSPIRMSIAAKGDWYITGRAGQANAANDDPNNTARRLNKQDNGTFTWLAVAPEGDYVDEQRVGSKPNGYVNIDATHRDYPDRASVGNELFTDLNFNGDATKGRLPLHALARLADVKRIEYTGQIVLQGIHPAANPGDSVTVESASSIGTHSVIKCVVMEADTQATFLELGSEESSAIYDQPMAPRTAGLHNGGAPTNGPDSGGFGGTSRTVQTYNSPGDLSSAPATAPQPPKPPPKTVQPPTRSDVAKSKGAASHTGFVDKLGNEDE